MVGVSMAKLLLNFHYGIFCELLDVNNLKELAVTSSFTLDTNSLLYEIPVLVKSIHHPRSPRCTAFLMLLLLISSSTTVKTTNVNMFCYDLPDAPTFMVIFSEDY